MTPKQTKSKSKTPTTIELNDLNQLNFIHIINARKHNLKNISVKIPKNKIVAITGVSGSGKSSLAFDILFEEGRSRYLQSIGLPPRLETENEFDLITGLSPTVGIEQRTTLNRNPRSTVGTKTGIYNLFRMLYALEGKRLCPICKESVGKDDACEICGMKVDKLQVKHFSFNEPSGMCLECKGKGYKEDFKLSRIIGDENLTLQEICDAASTAFKSYGYWIEPLSEFYHFDASLPYNQLSKKIQNLFLYGAKDKIPIKIQTKQYLHETEKRYEGVIPYLQRTMDESKSIYRKKVIAEKYMDRILCPECEGFRITTTARETLIGEKHIGEIGQEPIAELLKYLKRMKTEISFTQTGNALLERIMEELSQFTLLGIDYLHLNRSIVSLSGGENQRLGLMSQLNLGLNNCTFIMDEPTMGMHEEEKANLGIAFRRLQELGNTVLIVEHDEAIIHLADHIIDIGPLSGVNGGEVIFQGNYDDLLKDPNSITGKYLSNRSKYPDPSQFRTKNLDPVTQINNGKYLELSEVATNNLQNVNVKIPLEMMVGVCGVSGSGKSSLIGDTLVALLKESLAKAKHQKKKLTKKSTKSTKSTKSINSKRKSKSGKNEEELEGEEEEEDSPDPLEQITGVLRNADQIDDFIIVNQSPIGRMWNSNPSTYIGVWDEIRKLYADQTLAKKRKYKEGHFSFNSPKGRCPVCNGRGNVNLQISFLDNVNLPCEECNGQRYLPEILEVQYNGINIRQVLDLNISQALEVFQDEKKIVKYLKILEDIGMGYITLGQSATTLSGGEAQRIKLAKALGIQSCKNTLFILDEPSTGLHFHDEVKMLKLLHGLVKQGNSVIIVEHDKHILNQCDYLIEIGPGGGPHGGKIIATGTPQMIKTRSESIIKKYLD